MSSILGTANYPAYCAGSAVFAGFEGPQWLLVRLVRLNATATVEKSRLCIVRDARSVLRRPKQGDRHEK